MKKLYVFALTCAVTMLAACNDAEEMAGTEPAVVSDAPVSVGTRASLSTYQAPTYADDYSAMADWANRQLEPGQCARPTVMKADDGYYYMYQTDASYGNAMDGNGHFFCRRSRDLVNLQWVGSTMRTQPSWVATKVNEYRAAAGLAPIKHFRYGFWAPCARKVRSGLYRMYYCIVVDNYRQWVV
jgi:hypothetical protein